MDLNISNLRAANSADFKTTVETYRLELLDVVERTLRYAEESAKPASLVEEVAARGPRSHDFAGRYRRLGIRPGFSVSIGDLVAQSSFLGTGSAEPGLSITVMLEGAGEGWLTWEGDEHNSCPVGYGPGYLFIYFCRTPTYGRYDVPAQSRFLTVELRLDTSFLERSGLADIFERAEPSHPYCRICDDRVWIGRTSAPRSLQRLAQAMIDLDGEGATDPKLEACSLDLLAGAMSLMESPKSQLRKRQRQSQENRRDTTAIREVASLMLSDLSRGWVLSDLAERAGLSETKLKRVFRSVFGFPVYAYLQRARMEAARTMLRERPNVSMMEVSLEIGYANPSHFARLYRREFGMTPSQTAGRADENRVNRARSLPICASDDASGGHGLPESQF